VDVGGMFAVHHQIVRRRPTNMWHWNILPSQNGAQNDHVGAIKKVWLYPLLREIKASQLRVEDGRHSRDRIKISEISEQYRMKNKKQYTRASARYSNQGAKAPDNTSFLLRRVTRQYCLLFTLLMVSE
jgi:hypothetical protein